MLFNSEIKENDGFYSNNIEVIPNGARILRFYVERVRSEAVNTDVYIPKLINFIQMHHVNDLDGSDILMLLCYKFQDFLRPFVPGKGNLPIPWSYPIKEVWALLGRQVYIGELKVQNEEEMRRTVNQNILEFNPNMYRPKADNWHLC